MNNLNNCFNNVRYKTLKKITLEQIINETLNEDISDIDCYKDLVDVLEKCVFIMYPFYRCNKIRQEQNNISKKIKKYNKYFKCEVCGNVIEEIQIHHKIPVTRFGGNERTNIILCCKNCHNKKNKESFKN